MNEQNASNLVKHSDLGVKNLIKICLKIVQKVLKQPVECKLSKNFRGNISPDPPRPFLFLICFKIILPGKLRLEICQNLVHLP